MRNPRAPPHPVLGQSNAVLVGRTYDLTYLEVRMMPNPGPTYPSGVEDFGVLSRALPLLVDHGLPVVTPPPPDHRVGWFLQGFVNAR
jgi:hypothetical protein